MLWQWDGIQKKKFLLTGMQKSFLFSTLQKKAIWNKKNIPWKIFFWEKSFKLLSVLFAYRFFLKDILWFDLKNFLRSVDLYSRNVFRERKIDSTKFLFCLSVRFSWAPWFTVCI